MTGEKTEKIQAILDTNETLANAIRRSINKISTLAIDSVEIRKNDSALYDEILAQRIGLIPITSNRKLNELKDGEKPSLKTQIQIKLKVDGPATVYSGDIKGDVEMVYDKMPIVILDKEQSLELTGFVQLGVGTTHAKFSPGLAYYRNLTELKIKDLEKSKEIIKKLEGKLVEYSGGNLKVGDIILCAEDEDYVESLGETGSFEISQSEKLVFFIEPWGQIDAKEIFGEAVKCLNKELKSVLGIIK
ncbi:MAG: DNA-directed RNA polymerase subunit D [Nanoarchaeota archaeon]|nr:DNA-directed RNA polymerase subunit D [Nanoarchaeota archaeon]